jgi:aspartyl-tRNA(Asn)/glutamyl-tRNA(Gln) amidotransferase subunit A
VDLARLVARRELSPVEIISTCLDRIATFNPALNAIVLINPHARAQALEQERRLKKGDRVGPLCGVPFTVKDCIDVAGLRSTRGSKLFTYHIAEQHATAVRRLIEAGAILIGKTNLPEFALWWETDNLLFGRTSNPWRLDRIAGGSSGGEAAALAAGFSAIGIGSDVAGSIRMPAHFCGVVGLKPTHGLVPITGAWPEMLERYAHVGPLARSVEDIAAVLTVMAGPDGDDPYALHQPSREHILRAGDVSHLRIGVTETGGSDPVDKDVAGTVKAAALELGQLGCQVESLRIPALDDNDWNALSIAVVAPESSLYLGPILRGREDEIHPNLRARLEANAAVSLTSYLNSLRKIERLRRETFAAFRQFDAILAPCCAVSAFPHGQAELEIGGRRLGARHVLCATVPWNFTGSPALVLPFGTSLEGMPIGIQLIGRHFEEATLISIGLALERTSSRRGLQPSIPDAAGNLVARQLPTRL